MDDFRLRVFVTAARTLSFSKCAAALSITQPAVSRHIGELEGRFGVPLFVRGASGVSLTKAGELLLSHAERLLSDYQRLEYRSPCCRVTVRMWNSGCVTGLLI